MNKKRYVMPQATAIAMETEGPLLTLSDGDSQELPRAMGYYSDQAQMSQRKSIWDYGMEQ